jgi:hypothetical protein
MSARSSGSKQLKLGYEIRRSRAELKKVYEIIKKYNPNQTDFKK